MIRLLLCLALGMGAASAAQAQTYPERPIRLFIPLASASAVDVVARLIAAEMFARAVGVQMTHIPYRGVTPAVNEVLAGHVPVMFTALSTVSAFLPDRRMRILAATTPTRMVQLPDVPTVAESGVPGFSF